MPTLQLIALGLLSLGFIAAGVNHFVNPAFYLAMMPPVLPAPALLVQVSGVFEILGGMGVLLPQTRSFSGWGLVALLIAVFPANLQMALHPELFPTLPRWGLYARLPLQGALIAWAWWATRG